MKGKEFEQGVLTKGGKKSSRNLNISWTSFINGPLLEKILTFDLYIRELNGC